MATVNPLQQRAWIVATLTAMVVFCAPAQALAKWYNPFTWFGSGKQQAPALTEVQPLEEPPTRQTQPDPIAQMNGAVIMTEQGKIVIRFYEEAAPKTVANFKRLVEQDFYNAPGMVFHRVVEDFVIQTGDPTGTGYGGSKQTIDLEVDNHLKHDSIGVVAMARGPQPNSATSQFYITLSKQASLDAKYAIFAEVIQGLDVVSQIRKGDRVYGIELANVSNIPPEDRKAYGKEKKEKLFGLF